MNETTITFPEKNRSDIIDTIAQHRDEARALKWLCVIFFLALAYEAGPDLVTQYAVSGIEIREPEIVTTKRPLPPKRIARIIQELSRIQAAFPIARSTLQPEITALESLKELKPDQLSGTEREKRIAGHLETLWVFFSRPTWEDPSVFASAKTEIQTVMSLIKRELPESSELPPLPIGNRHLLSMDLPSRDIFNYSMDRAIQK